MARISKADYPRILQLVDTENVRVSEVAATYGCTPATIYAVLSKLRRAGVKPEPLADAEPPAEAAPPPDLFAAPQAEAVAPAPVPVAVPAVPRPVPAQPAPQEARPEASVTELPRKGQAGKRGGVGAALARPGAGLVMRTGDGDESTTPFRSIEDLLSAIKPILRAAARSPDAVWFSIRPIDLSELEYDAA